ncbi:MAG: hypothetical protein V1875_06070 [Candidatus Altiarchaeota archaeon]
MAVVKNLAYVVAAVSLLELLLPRGPIPDSFGPWLWSAAVAIAGSPLDFFPTQLRWLFGLVIGYLLIFVVYSAATGKKNMADVETADGSISSNVFAGFTQFVLETVHFAAVSAAGCVLGFSVAMIFKQEPAPEFPLKPLFWGFVFANAVVMITGWGRPRLRRITRPQITEKLDIKQPKLSDF